MTPTLTARLILWWPTPDPMPGNFRGLLRMKKEDANHARVFYKRSAGSKVVLGSPKDLAGSQDWFVCTREGVEYITTLATIHVALGANSHRAA